MIVVAMTIISVMMEMIMDMRIKLIMNEKNKEIELCEGHGLIIMFYVLMWVMKMLIPVTK